MSVESISPPSPSPALHEASDGQVERRRVTVLVVFLSIVAILAIPAYLLWPHPSGKEGTYLLSDFNSGRGLWWWLLTSGAALTVLMTAAQAIAVLVIVRERGATWADWGAGLMLLGSATQAAGLAGVGASYYSASNPNLPRNVGLAMFSAINHDQRHLFGALLAGELIAVIGTVLQAVALVHSRALPKWVPILSLFVVLSIVAPVESAASLVFTVPMAAAAIGLAYYAYHQVQQ